jgi:hypothetical protein
MIRGSAGSATRRHCALSSLRVVVNLELPDDLADRLS